MMTAAKWRQRILSNPEELGHFLGYTKLTKEHGTMIHYIWGNKNKKDCLLLAHRGSYKTTAIVVVGVIWFLLFQPEQTILLVRKEYNRAAAVLLQIREHYKSHKMKAVYESLGLYEEARLPSGVPLLANDKEDTIKLVTKKEITAEGNIEITGITGKGVTGRHYDRIHMDDVVVDVDRDSKVEREKTKRVYQNLKSVIKPGKLITATGTPWHRLDLYSTFGVVKKYPIGTLKIEGFTEAEIKQKRTELTPSQFSSQYELEFVPESGQLFSEIKLSQEFPKGVEVVGHIDPAFGGDDTTALTLAAYGKEKLIVWGRVFENHIVENYQKIAEMVKRTKARMVFVENNGDKGATARDLRKLGISTLGYHETTNKHTKISTSLYQHWQFISFYKETSAEYLEQVREYVEGSEPDDAPDSLASLLIKKQFRPEVKKKPYSREDFSPSLTQKKKHWGESLL